MLLFVATRHPAAAVQHAADVAVYRISGRRPVGRSVDGLATYVALIELRVVRTLCHRLLEKPAICRQAQQYDYMERGMGDWAWPGLGCSRRKHQCRYGSNSSNKQEDLASRVPTKRSHSLH